MDPNYRRVLSVGHCGARGWRQCWSCWVVNTHNTCTRQHDISKMHGLARPLSVGTLGIPALLSNQITTLTSVHSTSYPLRAVTWSPHNNSWGASMHLISGACVVYSEFLDGPESLMRGSADVLSNHQHHPYQTPQAFWQHRTSKSVNRS